MSIYIYSTYTYIYVEWIHAYYAPVSWFSASLQIRTLKHSNVTQLASGKGFLDGTVRRICPQVVNQDLNLDSVTQYPCS